MNSSKADGIIICPKCAKTKWYEDYEDDGTVSSNSNSFWTCSNDICRYIMSNDEMNKKK